mgnify:CR=1 FL=1
MMRTWLFLNWYSGRNGMNPSSPNGMQRRESAMKLEMLLLQPWMFLLLVALLALVQAVWARSAKRWQGVILPVVYELFFARQTLGALHYSSTGPRYLPDYYLFSMLFVSGIALALVFYAAWYAWRCRQ